MIMKMEQKMRLTTFACATAAMLIAALVIANAARAEQQCFYDWSPAKGTWYHCIDPGPNVYDLHDCRQTWDPVNGDHRQCRR
jgi:hypothetical protein